MIMIMTRLQESESQIFVTEGSPESLIALQPQYRADSGRVRIKNSGPFRCPRGYRGGTAAGVRSNTFILHADLARNGPMGDVHS
jgi:hypothetical protein